MIDCRCILAVRQLSATVGGPVMNATAPGDSKGEKNNQDSDAKAQKFTKEPWFAKLPPALQNAIQANRSYFPHFIKAIHIAVFAEGQTRSWITGNWKVQRNGLHSCPIWFQDERFAGNRFRHCR